jgi:hypothetical protein
MCRLFIAIMAFVTLIGHSAVADSQKIALENINRGIQLRLEKDLIFEPKQTEIVLKNSDSIDTGVDHAAKWRTYRDSQCAFEPVTGVREKLLPRKLLAKQVLTVLDAKISDTDTKKIVVHAVNEASGTLFTFTCESSVRNVLYMIVADHKDFGWIEKYDFGTPTIRKENPTIYTFESALAGKFEFLGNTFSTIQL